MYKRILLLISILAAILFFACEKDDICVEGDTPLLVIEFYDVTDTTLLKDVPNLAIQGFIEPDSTLTELTLTSTNTVSVPLRINEANTQYLITQQLTDADTTETNLVTFNYKTLETYLGRACGYAATFDDLNSELEAVDDLWIKEIRIDTLYVNNTVQTNVKILH